MSKILVADAAEVAVKQYKCDTAAVTMEAVNRLAEAGAAALVREPRLQHSRKHAAYMLDMSVSQLADYIKANVIKVRREGGRPVILDTELRRFIKEDCKKPPMRGKKKPPLSAKPAALSEPKLG